MQYYSSAFQQESLAAKQMKTRSELNRLQIEAKAGQGHKVNTPEIHR